MAADAGGLCLGTKVLFARAAPFADPAGVCLPADADALNHEQGYHKQYLYELDNLDKASAEFAQKVADFRADLNAHIREEEDKIFPKIHAGLDADKNKALTAAANREGFKLA